MADSISTSPASSGPAGPHFEGQVGAYYLLSMLTGSDARGLPGASIDRVEFQRAGEGRALDDVIVYAHDQRGSPAVLEIQVKRSIKFTPADPIFRGVVEQIAKASGRPDFWTTRYELAIAIARTSHQIDGSYQEVLSWARQIGSPEIFFARVGRKGAANDHMRTFVETISVHLQEFGILPSQDVVWGLLRRLQILAFDFTQTGSASEELARDRCVRALSQEQAGRAPSLWSVLIEKSVSAAANGGDRNRQSLAQELQQASFSLAEPSGHSQVRQVLSEASGHALSDIGDRVGSVTLTRSRYVTAVHSALDEGRYVEIRGAGGVGKSWVLKHVAEQLRSESDLLVLSPGRTQPGGWLAFRGMLGYAGTAPMLLTELASSGGAAIFVDGLDRFNEGERKTIGDLVREAAQIPGFVVIVTARHDFDVDEPNWLHSDALDKLGRANPVVVGELIDEDIQELTEGDARLAAILSDAHPAQPATRNLFRLARLSVQPMSGQLPHTEVDMAQLWWRTADGRVDSELRERSRLLRSLAEQLLAGASFLDVSSLPSPPIEALIHSETLRDLSHDRVAFRHDVLGEWALANLLFLDPGLLDRLTLTRPASALMARAIELTARMTLERSGDAQQWLAMLEKLGRAGAHGSWKRAGLLAIVRSEIAVELLRRSEQILLGSQTGLLRELIRTVIAVEVEPAADRLAKSGFDVATLPKGLNVPTAASWLRLIRWLLDVDDRLPATLIPDVAELFMDWSVGRFGFDSLTPLLLARIYRWLTEIESAREADTFRDLREPFNGAIERRQLDLLESNLRAGFLLFCDRVPTLAAGYLQSLMQRRHAHDAIHSVLKFRGSLAKAAPAQLVEFTLAALLPKDADDTDRHSRRPFGPFDIDLYPASPVQGPFLELLTAASSHGLRLVRAVVDHAITHHSGGITSGSTSLIIRLPDGERRFPWQQSYGWPRQWGGRSAAVTSALMALELWAHRRLDAGEPIDQVLKDILDYPGVSAAFLMVAVDLILSHWPASADVAIGFVGCPELLCLDRDRQSHEATEIPDVFGLRDHQTGALGLSSLKQLAQRPSRRRSLYDHIGEYTFGARERREKLEGILRDAAERLGAPDANSTLTDPAFMTAHALSLLNPDNWRTVSVEGPDGQRRNARQYVSPELEAQQLAALRATGGETLADIALQAQLGTVLDHPEKGSQEFAEAGVNWAQRAEAQSDDGDDAHRRMRDLAVLTASVITMRDGTAELRATHARWARTVLERALQTPEDSVHRFRSGLRYNPIGLAFFGIVLLLRESRSQADIQTILALASRADPAAAHGFRTAIAILASIDDRLPQCVLRCALVGRLYFHRFGGMTEEVESTRVEQRNARATLAIQAELKFLSNDGREPAWPTFPDPMPRVRKHLRLFKIDDVELEPRREPVTEERVDHQAAALWLSATTELTGAGAGAAPWLRDAVETYADWTALLNGSGLASTAEISERPAEWNRAYYDLLARCLGDLDLASIDRVALDKICSLPDESFFDVVAVFVYSIDAVYFGERQLTEEQAVHIRSVLAKKLVTSRGWRRLKPERSGSIEMHLGPAGAVMFFNEYQSIHGQPRCYLLPKGVDRIDPFIPTLSELAKSGASFFVALVTLTLIEVAPRIAHVQFLLEAAAAWLEVYPTDSSFWVDQKIGGRVCSAIASMHQCDPTLFRFGTLLRGSVDHLLAALVSLGVSDASRLERVIETGPQ